jgi:hypothetical protein
VPRADVNTPEGGLQLVQTRTAPDGTFELQLIEPGEYFLGFNFLRTSADQPAVPPRALYPGVPNASEAVAIAVTTGQRVRLRNFLLPDTIRLVTLGGTIVDQAGSPVRDVSVWINPDGQAGGGSAGGPALVTGEDGRFAFTVAEGGRYSVGATRYVGTTARTSQVHQGMHTFSTATSGARDATIVLKPSVP